MSENEKRDSIISKILKLMDLGNMEKNDSSHQRDAAMKKVAQLMAEYSIDFADLRINKQEGSPFIKIDVDGTEYEVVDFESTLGYAIAKAFDCKIINTFGELYMKTGIKGHWQLSFVGTKHDLDIVVYFFQYLRRTVHMMGIKYINALGSGPKSKLKGAKHSYCLGLVATIGERLEELYKRKEQFIPSECRAMVLVKKDKLEETFNDMFPRKHTRKNNIRDTKTFLTGRIDGNRVNLSRPISSNGYAAEARLGA